MCSGVRFARIDYIIASPREALFHPSNQYFRFLNKEPTLTDTVQELSKFRAPPTMHQSPQFKPPYSSPILQPPIPLKILPSTSLLPFAVVDHRRRRPHLSTPPVTISHLLHGPPTAISHPFAARGTLPPPLSRTTCATWTTRLSHLQPPKLTHLGSDGELITSTNNLEDIV